MPALNASGGPGYAHAGVGDQRQHYAQIGFSAWDGELSSAPATVTIDIAAQADAPTLSLLGDTVEANGVGLNHGLEDLTIALQTLVAGLTDVDGSEQLVLTLTGLPLGSVLSDGAASSTGLGGHRFMPSDSQHVVNLAGWRLDALQLTPPPNFSGTINLAVQATANGNRASTERSLSVQVQAVADAPSVAWLPSPSTDVGPSRELFASQWEGPSVSSTNPFTNSDVIDGWRSTAAAATKRPTLAVYRNGYKLVSRSGDSVAVQAAASNGSSWVILNNGVTFKSGVGKSTGPTPSRPSSRPALSAASPPSTTRPTA